VSAALALVAILSGCGTGRAAPVPSPAVPRAFADDSFAELATDGSDALWLAVSGYRRDGRFGLRVYRGEGAGWAALPIPPGEVSGDLPISIAVREKDEHATPCIGYSLGAAQRPAVACLAAGRWRRLDLPSLGGSQLFQVADEDGKLTALFLERAGQQTRYRLLSEGEDGWRLSPPLPASPATAQLAIEGPRGQATGRPSLGVTTQGRRTRRYVVELRNGAWRRIGPTVADAELGPTVGGPVVLSGRVLYPVNEAASEPWSFSIEAAEVGGGEVREAARLSTGAGNAQGRLDLAGGQLWATWQEDDPRRDGRFDAGLYAARLSPRGETLRKVKLWQGISIGPGSTQVDAIRGRLQALFMPASRNGKGLRTALRVLP
jgi:hypothetical protein